MTELWQPEILGRYLLKDRGDVVFVSANRQMDRSTPECVGEHVIIDGAEVVVVAVERNLPASPIRAGETIGLLTKPLS